MPKKKLMDVFEIKEEKAKKNERKNPKKSNSGGQSNGMLS